MRKYLPQFNSNLFYIFKQYLLLLLLFAGFRAALLLGYGISELYHSYLTDILKAFIYGIRYDSVITLYALLLLAAINVIGIFISPLSDKWIKSVVKAGNYYMPVVYAFIISFLVADYYYFGYYQTHFNILLFGLWEDDTQAILTSVYKDYPLFKISFIVLLLVYLVIKWNKHLSKKHKPELSRPAIFSIIFIPLFVVSYFFGMRGTWRGMVLCIQENGVVSANNFINDLLPNGIFTLREALEQRYKNELPADTSMVLREYKIENSSLLYSGYSKLLGNDSSFYWKKTPTDTLLEKDPPDIIFIQMESFGGDLLRYQSAEFNLLGELESEYKNALLFPNFKCGNSMTIHSLEGLLINALMTPVSYTKSYDHFYSSSNLSPFLQNNYRTKFATGGRLSWHNMGKFLEKQGFQETAGSEAIKKELPDCEDKDWGVPDEYLFEYILKTQKISDTPYFLYAMSISNHTPYDIPESYKVPELNLPDSLKKRLKCSMDVAKRNLASYRYANDCLGSFIKKLKSTPRSSKTIIAITGDHFCHDLFNYTEEEYAVKFNVPLILIIPDQYKKNKAPNLSGFGSHKDIFPTLFHLSLSNVCYFNAGNDLLGKDNATTFYSFMKTTPTSSDFCIMNESGFVSKHAAQYTYFKWNSGNYINAENTQPSKEMLDLEKTGNIYNAALNVHQIKDK